MSAPPVKIEPVPQYLGVHEDRYAFAYTIHITNEAPQHTHLYTHW